MARSKGNKRGSRHGRRTAAGATASDSGGAPVDIAKVSRRTFLGAAVLAIPALFIGLETHQRSARADISVIGDGRPAVVQAHDPGCPECRELLRNAESAHARFDDTITFRVVDITQSEGADFCGTPRRRARDAGTVRRWRGSTADTPGGSLDGAVARGLQCAGGRSRPPLTPGCTSTQEGDTRRGNSARRENGVPKGIRTPVTAVKGRCPNR